MAITTIVTKTVITTITAVTVPVIIGAGRLLQPLTTTATAVDSRQGKAGGRRRMTIGEEEEGEEEGEEVGEGVGKKRNLTKISMR